MTDGDDPERESSTRPLARAAGVLAGIASLAGCTDRRGDSIETDSPTGAEPTATAPRDRSGTVDSDATSRGTPGGSDRSTTASPTPSCDDRAEALRAEIEDLDAELWIVEELLTAVRLQHAFNLARRGWYPGGFDQDVLDTAASVADDVADSVVRLVVGDGDPYERHLPWDPASRAGTAWFRHPDTLVTNAHVAAGVFVEAGYEFPPASDPGPLTATGVTRDGDRFEARLAGWELEQGEDHATDVAVFQTEYEGTPLTGGSTADLTPGQPLVQVGHPASFGTWTPSLGRYLYDRETNHPDGSYGVPVPRGNTFLSSLPTQGGNSGSPAVTLDGELVGMLFGIFQGPVDYDIDESWNSFVYDRPIEQRDMKEHNSIEVIDDLIDDWT